MLQNQAKNFKATEDEAAIIAMLGNIGVEEKEGEDKMEEENAAGRELKEFKDKIIKVLEELEYAQKRPSKLALEDFLKLLYHFNKNDIHFR